MNKAAYMGRKKGSTTYTVEDANTAEILVEDAQLCFAMQKIGIPETCRGSFLRAARTGNVYRGFIITSKNESEEINGPVVSVQMDDGRKMVVSFFWAWEQVRKQRHLLHRKKP